MALWIECQPVDLRVTGSIPSQGTCLGCRLGPHLGACERQPHTNVSLPLSLPFPLSKNINKIVYIHTHTHTALAGVARWLERRLTHQTVVGSVPGQGTCLGCGFRLYIHTHTHTHTHTPCDEHDLQNSFEWLMCQALDSGLLLLRTQND